MFMGIWRFEQFKRRQRPVTKQEPGAGQEMGKEGAALDLIRPRIYLFFAESTSGGSRGQEELELSFMMALC